MSNYLKKLAYVHEAMKKMAASNDFPGMFIEMPMTYDLGLPTVDEFKKQWGLSNAKQGLLPPELEDELSYAVTAPQVPSVLTPESQVALEAPNLDFIEPYAQATSRPNNVADMRTMQMAKRIDQFQKEYIKRYATANAITEDEARTRLGAKGKLYDTSDMTSLIAQMNDPKLRRLRDIATGRKTIDNYKWRAPGGMKGVSYATAQQYMDDRRQNKMNKMHGGAAEQALLNPAAMPNIPANAAQPKIKRQGVGPQPNMGNTTGRKTSYSTNLPIPSAERARRPTVSSSSASKATNSSFVSQAPVAQPPVQPPKDYSSAARNPVTYSNIKGGLY